MRRLRMLIVVALCAGIGYGLREYWLWRELHPATDDAYVQAHIVDIAARVSGPVVAVHVDENDYVEAGDVLFEIDPSTFAAAVDAARAAYDMAAQTTGASDAEVGVARSTLEERKVTLARAKRNLERATALNEANLIAEAEYDNAVATEAEAEAAVASAAADLRRAESQFGKRGNQNSRLRAAAAALTAAELELSFTRVVAPVSGWISNCTLREGAMVIEERAQFSIVEDRHWWVEANFKETDLTHLRPGQAAHIAMDMYPGLVLDGEVESLGAGSGAVFSLLPPENATGNWVKVTQRFPVRVAIAPRHDDPDNLRPLRVGASATVTVDVEP
ncbi:MAG: HlyD family secretion protein [Gammaproteobacteria bacterium]|nr:HlyD family secretion protein [Gammaproteobacteria bacterium]MCP5201271.1 HlyD family secretion protein [Gammaproteobacteria bacterium]